MRLNNISAACLLFALLLPACSKKEHQPAGKEGTVTKTVTVQAAVPVDTKVVMGAESGGKFPFTWSSEGEKMQLTERRKVSGAAYYSVASYTSSSSTVSVDGQTAGFVFDVKSVSGSGVFQYRCLSPASAFREATTDGIVVNLPAAQTPSGTSPDPAAILVWGEKILSSQSENLVFDHPLSHAVGTYVRLHVSGAPAGTLKAELECDGKVLAGDAGYSYATKVFSPKEGGSSRVSADVSALHPGTEFDVFYGVFPFTMTASDRLTVRLFTSDKCYYKTVSMAVEVLPSALTRMDVDMSGAAEGDVINGSVIEPANTLVGLVTDAVTGAGLPGVPVTDGYTFTATDGNGVYQFKAHADARLVYLTIPADCEFPVAKDGEPDFWKKIGTGWRTRHDFVLKKRASVPDNFNVIGMTDIHFTLASESSEREEELFETHALPDINGYISSRLSAEPLIILNTGDNVSNYTGYLPKTRELFAKIKRNGVTVPMFMTIGNHDHTNVSTDDLSATEPWMETYGPTDFSFNMGRAHIVCMKNIHYDEDWNHTYGKSMAWTKGLTDEQWAWLQQDLSYVQDRDKKLLLFCCHAPIQNNSETHYADLRLLLKTFSESHILSGHNHYSTHRQFASPTWNGTSGRISEEHNMPPLGGLWRSHLANDGAAAGYHVFQVKGDMVARHWHKALDCDENYQMRVYDGGQLFHEKRESRGSDYYDAQESDGKYYWYFNWGHFWENAAGKFIVHVFDAGSLGTGYRVYFEKNGTRTEMTRDPANKRDQCAFSYFYNVLYDTSGKGPSASTASTYGGSNRPAHFWSIDAPGGHPSLETGWKVILEIDQNDGTTLSYETSTLQTDYSGFGF